MKQYDFKPLIDFLTDDITLTELCYSLSSIYMRFTALRIENPDTICNDDTKQLYLLYRIIEILHEINNK